MFVLVTGAIGLICHELPRQLVSSGCLPRLTACCAVRWNRPTRLDWIDDVSFFAQMVIV